MSKYAPLREYLARLPEMRWTASFLTLEHLLGAPLPPSAAEHRTWWANHGGPMVHQAAWMDAGWRVVDVDLAGRSVTFQRARIGGVAPTRPAGRDGRSPSQAVSSLTVRVGWRPLGIGRLEGRSWRLPSAPRGPGLCRLTPLDLAAAEPQIKVVDDLKSFLAPGASLGEGGLGDAFARRAPERVMVDVAPEQDVWIIVDGKGRRADLLDPLDRGLVRTMAEAAARRSAGEPDGDR